MQKVLKLITIVFFISAAGLALGILRPETAPSGIADLMSVSWNATTKPLAPEGGLVRFGRTEPLAVGQSREVALAADLLTTDQMTERQRRDQLLDWLLIAVVSDIEPNPEVINRIFADLPLLRHGYTKPLGVLEFGPTRARLSSDDAIVALIPGNISEEARRDFIAHIGDGFRKDLGGRFVAVKPFEYQLDATGRAVLTRLPDVSPDQLRSVEFGYLSALVRDRASLLRFLAAADDLTYVKSHEGGIELGGRKIRSRKYRGIGIEHVATIWQAEKKIHEELAAWEAFKKPLIDAFDSRWRHRSYRYEHERRALEAERDAELRQLEAKISAEAKQRNVKDHTGFSLDPDYYFDGLREELARLGELMLSAGLAPSDAGPILNGLSRRDILPLLRYEEKLQKSRNPSDRQMMLLGFIKRAHDKHTFQAARYDGNLAGTEVGMILYYTDLLAKLWALDFENSAPTRLVPGFLTDLIAPVSIAYREESELYPYARLWFGPSNLGYQRTAGNEMLFRRSATRIYSAGSNPLEPGKEVQTSVALNASTDWWNDHYEEVEWAEPEYQRLNQIMKWSIVIGWLLNEQSASRWDFLTSEQVNRSHWFPDWVKRQPQLAFKAWDAITFYPRGAMGTKTEALPQLRSRSFKSFEKDMFISGGVSLARSSEIRARALMPSEFPTLIRRSNIDYSASSARGTIKTLEGLTYSINNIERGAVTTVKAPTDTKLRGTYAQMRNGTFERDAISASDGLAMAMRVDGQPIGQLGIKRNGNGFQVIWKAQDLEAGTALARKLSKSSDISSTLQSAREVEAAFAIPGKQQYLVKIAGSRRWAVLEVEQRPAATLSSGAHARAGEIGGGRSIEVTIVETEQAQRMALGARPIRGGRAVDLQAQTRLEESLAGQRFVDASDVLAGMRGDLARRTLGDKVVNDLAMVTELHKQGNIGRALANVEDLIEVFGPIPEVSLKKASLLLEQGRLQQAAEATKGMTRVEMRNPQTFFDELSGRLKQVPLAPSERLGLETLGDIAALHQRAAAVRDLGQAPKVMPYADKGRLQIGYQVEPGKRATQVPRENLGNVNRDVVVYVEDNPALSNLDWSVSLAEAMRRPVPGAKVLYYSDANLATFRPAKVFSGDGKRSYNRVRGTTSSEARNAAWQAAARAGAQSTGSQSPSNGPCNAPPGARPPAATCPIDRDVFVIALDEAAL
jgi:hypothetical protein